MRLKLPAASRIPSIQRICSALQPDSWMSSNGCVAPMPPGYVRRRLTFPSSLVSRRLNRPMPCSLRTTSVASNVRLPSRPTLTVPAPQPTPPSLQSRLRGHSAVFIILQGILTLAALETLHILGYASRRIRHSSSLSLW